MNGYEFAFRCVVLEIVLMNLGTMTDPPPGRSGASFSPQLRQDTTYVLATHQTCLVLDEAIITQGILDVHEVLTPTTTLEMITARESLYCHTTMQLSILPDIKWRPSATLLAPHRSS